MSSIPRRFRAATGGLPPLFWTLWAGMLVNRLASFVITFLALYLVSDRGFTASQAGHVVAIYGLGLLLAGPLGGALADRIGRRRTMLLGLTLGGGCVAVLGFLRDPAWLTFLAFLAALTGDIYRPAAQAAVADIVAPADRARAYGLIYWAVNLGWAVSLSVAGFVAERSMLALFLADAATSLAFALIVLARVPETRPTHHGATPALQGLLRFLGDGPFLVFLGLHLAVLLVFTQFQLAAAARLRRPRRRPARPSPDHGAQRRRGGGAAAAALARPAAPRRRPRAGPLLAPHRPRLRPQRLRRVAGRLRGRRRPLHGRRGAGLPGGLGLVADLAPPDLRGRYQGAFYMSWGMAFTLSPLVGGEVLQRFGGTVLWLGCLATGAVAAALHLAAGPARRRRLGQGAHAMVSPR